MKQLKAITSVALILTLLFLCMIPVSADDTAIVNTGGETTSTEDSTLDTEAGTYSTENATNEAEPVPYTILGDVDSSGDINILDASMLQFHVVDLIQLDQYAELRGDTNLDNGTDVFDVTHMQRYIAGFSGAFYLGREISQAKADKQKDEDAVKKAKEQAEAAKAKAAEDKKKAEEAKKAAKEEAALRRERAKVALAEYRKKLKEIEAEEKRQKEAEKAKQTNPKKTEIDNQIKNYKKTKGVDISEFNGNVDFNKLKKAGYKFVMIRMGWGSNLTSQDDSMFATNVKKAEAAGIPWGAYLYSYALNVSSAKSEVNHTLRLLKGKKPTMPIAFDQEEDSYKSSHGFTNKALHDVTATYLKGIAAAGYYPILYTGYDQLTGPLNTKDVVGTYDVWYAQWYTVMQYNTKKVGIWQYGGEVNYLESPYISGLSGAFDKDFCFKNYPVLIPAYGYNNHQGLFDKKLAPTAADFNDDELYIEDGEKIPDEYKGVMGESFRNKDH